MARIDNFLAQLIAYEADALLVESGDNLYLVKGEQRLPLMQVKPGAIANPHVVALLLDIAPDELRSRVERGEPSEWDHRWGTCLFRVELGVLPDGRYVARVRAIADHAKAVAPAPLHAVEDVVDGAPSIERYFRFMVERGASDLHLTAGRAPMARIDGDMVPLPGFAVLEPYGLQKMIEEILPDRSKVEFEATNDTDFAYEMSSARIRCNIFRDRTGVGGVFRNFSRQLRSAEAIGVPSAVIEMCKQKSGLVIVTGPSGSGKSTTLAALVDWINENRSDHIITIEDPVELVHEPKRCLINQRQVGEHTGSYARALRAAYREDPDVILVAELRDLETISTAIEMAETGHLVLATLHTTTAAGAIDRLLDPFPAERQEQIRTTLAATLKGVVAQTLCKREGGGRIAAIEVLCGTPEIARLIRERRTAEIPETMQSLGMRTLDDVLMDLVMSGHVARDEALARAVNRGDLLSQLTQLKMVA